ncbi:MAG: pentapeptide repeat-containing protein, partial [Promethearchaeota archaeon]
MIPKKPPETKDRQEQLLAPLTTCTYTYRHSADCHKEGEQCHYTAEPGMNFCWWHAPVEGKILSQRPSFRHDESDFHFCEAHLTRATLHNADLVRAKLNNAKLSGADLRSANLW